MKKVLIISYYFPPNPAIGSLRIKGLAKFLPDFEWEPIILTVEPQEDKKTKFKVITTTRNVSNLDIWKKRFGLKTDQSVKKQIGAAGSKNKKMLSDIPLDLAYELITYPDEQKGWYPYAVKAGRSILKKEKVEAILSSSSPVTCHLIGKQLKKEFKVPWTADFRDLWTQNHYYPYSPIRRLIERRLELKTLSKANALVTVSQPFAENMGRLHKRKVYVIPNGFDPDDLKNTKVDVSNKFTITYTGILYSGKRDPSKLFQAMKELIEERRVDPRDVEIRFYGPQEDWMPSEIERYGLKGIAVQNATIPRELALDKQRESQILLLLLWDHPQEVGMLPAKVFEYLAAKRPILAIGGPIGVVKDLLEQTNAGEYASTVEEIKKSLEKSYSDYKSKRFIEYHGIDLEINKYSQIEMARKFSGILDDITNKNLKSL